MRRSPVADVILLLAVALAARTAEGEEKKNRSLRWESAIQKFEQHDQESPPEKGGILFVGSSSILFWDLEKYFPDLKPLNRGFGGSEVADSVYFADRVVLPYEPRLIVLYAGDNDIDRGKTACQVHADFQEFVRIVHESLPQTRILYISIKPSLQRWKLVHQMRAANALILATCHEDDRLEFVDIDSPMIGEDGKPRPELFIEDGLHLSPAGYTLWTERLEPYLK